MTAPRDSDPFKRDPDRLIRAFLAEGPAELPDRAFDGVRSRIDRTHQRVVIGPWREPRMSTFARLAIVAVAVIVVGVVAIELGPWRIESAAPPNPSPSPSPSPAQEPSPLPPSGALEPGTYRSSSGSMAITFTVPAGWTSFQGWAVLKGDPEMAVAPWEVRSVPADPCHRAEMPPPIGPTVDDLVSALVAQVRDTPATVTEVVVDGYHGKQVELVVPTDIDLAQCDGGQYISWFDTTGGWRYSQGPGQHDVVRILDVNGRRLVVNSAFFDANSAADRAELQAVFDSVRIEPGAAATATPPAYTWPASLAAGTYSTSFAWDLPLAFTFTVPDGWQSRDINIVKDGRLSMMVWLVNDLYADPCSGTLREQAIGPTVDDLAEGLATMPGLDATAPTSTALAGLAGRYLEFSVRADAGCRPDQIRIAQLRPLVCGSGCAAVGGSDVGLEFPVDRVRTRVWVLDAGGRLRVVVAAVSTPEATQAELDELQAVVDSLRVERTVPATPAPQPAGT